MRFFGRSRNLVEPDVEAMPQQAIHTKHHAPERSTIAEAIRVFAKSEWPDDFSMQRHVIEEQTEAYNWLQNFVEPRVPPADMDKIFVKAIEEWPSDFAMQKHVVEEQVEAYLWMLDN